MARSRRVTSTVVIGVACVLGLGAGGPLDGQVAGSSVVEGRVVDATTGAPIPNAVATLSGAALGPWLNRNRVPDPLRPAQVTAVTGDDGRFAFTALPAGRFDLQVTAEGYLASFYNSRFPGDPVEQIDVEPGARRAGLDIRLWPGAAITGRVTDEDGAPVADATVWAQAWTSVAGRRRLGFPRATVTGPDGRYRIDSLVPGEYVVALPSSHATLSNETPPRQLGTATHQAHGISRGIIGEAVGPLKLYSLRQPRVRSRGDGQVRVYPTTFYPGVADSAMASIVRLGLGDRRADIDLELVAARTVTVSGRLDGPSGDLSDIAVRLARLDAGDCSRPTFCETAVALTDPRGAFTIAGVVPGTYEIRAARREQPAWERGSVSRMTVSVFDGVVVRRGHAAGNTTTIVPLRLPSTLALWTRSQIVVPDDGVRDLALPLTTGHTIEGRMEFDGALPAPSANARLAVGINIETSSGRSWFSPESMLVAVTPDGSFGSVGLPDDRYLIRVGNAPEGWALESVLVDGRDASVEPLLLTRPVNDVRIVFTDRPTMVSGSVGGPSGVADSNTVVVVFPTDRARWIDHGENPRDLKMTRLSKTGAYAFRGLPPGEYFLATATGIESTWRDADALAGLIRDAVIVEVSQHGRVVRNLTVAR
jgi:protocatechuate 3,4-dioxygenase beta subunit